MNAMSNPRKTGATTIKGTFLAGGETICRTIHAYKKGNRWFLGAGSNDAGDLVRLANRLSHHDRNQLTRAAFGPTGDGHKTRRAALAGL